MKWYYITIFLSVVSLPVVASERKPNIVYLMLDEWGYFEIWPYGPQGITYPNIDRFAAEVCAYQRLCRCSSLWANLQGALLTGLHAGHMSMRTNNGHSPIRAGEPTLASVLKKMVTALGGFGKWGIGGRGTSGSTWKKRLRPFLWLLRSGSCPYLLSAVPHT